MEEIIVKYILLFFAYAFIGWCLEVTCKIIEFRRFVNRGFLIGPICPIYGWGVLGILLINHNSGNDVLSVFLKSMMVCSILEYFTSWFMEVFFKARWWDYSRRKFNLNGRICLETMIPFGLLGVFVVYILNPIISGTLGLLSPTARLVICSIFVTAYVIDNFISFFIVKKIKGEIKDTAKDNTEYIREKVFAWIDDNSFIYRRIKDAYPDFDIKGKIKVVEDEIVKTVLVTNDRVIVYRTKLLNNGKKAKEKTKEYNVKSKERVNLDLSKHRHKRK